MFYYESVIRKVHEKQKGLKLNGTRQLLFYADEVNISNRNVHAVMKKKRGLSSRE